MSYCLECLKEAKETKYHESYWDHNKVIGKHKALDIWSDEFWGYLSLCCRSPLIEKEAQQILETHKKVSAEKTLRTSAWRR